MTLWLENLSQKFSKIICKSVTFLEIYFSIHDNGTHEGTRFAVEKEYIALKARSNSKIQLSTSG